MTYRVPALLHHDMEPATDVSALTYDLRNLDPRKLTREDVDRLATLIDKFSEQLDELEDELAQKTEAYKWAFTS